MPSFILQYKKQLLIALSVIGVLVGVVVYNMTNSTPTESNMFIQKQPLTSENTPSKTEEKPVEEPKINSLILVDVKGAVKHPGVYKLEEDARVVDAIQLAGGYTAKAQSKKINHAQKVTDEMVIYVPKKGEKEEAIDFFASQAESNSTSVAGQGAVAIVNINTADTTQLQTLNGIGPAKAQTIIEYRETNGQFTAIEDLLKVSGIGEKTLEKLRNSISVQ